MIKKSIPFMLTVGMCLLIAAGVSLISRTFAQTSDPIESQLQQADSLRVEGKYTEAEAIYQDIINQYPGTDYALRAEKGLTITYIESGNEAGAQQAYTKLLTDFGSNIAVVPAVYEIGEKYRQFAKFQSSIDTHQFILDNFPESAQAIWAKRSVAASYIGLGDISTAEIEAQQLTNNFADNPNIAQAVFEVADTYCWFKKYEEADELYEHVTQNWPDSHYAMWAQMGLAISSIRNNNESKAQSAVDLLAANYGSDPNVPEAFFYIAETYKGAGNIEKTKQTHQYVLDTWLHFPKALSSQMGLTLLNIEEGNDVAAMGGADNLIANFSDHPEAPPALLIIAEKFSRKAWNKRSEDDETSALDYFNRSVQVREKLIANIPNTTFIAQTYYTAGVVYAQNLKEYDKGIDYFQSVIDNWPDYKYAWHAQYFIGKYTEKLMNEGAISQDTADAIIKQAYKNAVENYPASPAYLWACKQLGNIYYDQQTWTEAVQYLEMALDKCYQQNEKNWIYKLVYRLGDAYKNIGQTENARTVYTEYLEKADETYPGVYVIKKELDKLQGD